MTEVLEFVHSCYSKTKNNEDAVVVKVHKHDTETGTVTPGIHIVRNPKRSFYVTKKGLQTHKLKKEWEDINNLDKYVVPNSQLSTELSRALYGYPRTNSHVRELCNSPYVYGADIDIQTLIKKKMQDDFAKSKLSGSKITTGFLDTETSVLADSEGELILITSTHENKVYTGILKGFFFKIDPVTKNRTAGDVAELDIFVKEIFKKHINKYKFEFEYFVGNTPGDLVQWIFSKIHKNCTDFIGVWNLDFDINVLLKVMQQAELNPADLMSHPDVPSEFRYAKYRPDTKDVDHFTKKWHMMNNTSGTQFVDSMCLYSILRTVKGKEFSYSLDAILKKEGIDGGKLTFTDDDPELDRMSKLDWHRHMQTYEFYKYIAYNQFDAMSIQILEWKNNDIDAMNGLLGVSHVSSYNKTTRRVVDSMYFFCLDKQKVLASAGTDMTTEYDQYVSKTGGAVLKAENTYQLGLAIFEDAINLFTYLTAHNADSDFSSLYPLIQAAMNIARETKVSTSIAIEGMTEKATQHFHSMMISTTENAVQIGRDYYGLGGYEEVETAFLTFINNNEVPSQPEIGI